MVQTTNVQNRRDLNLLLKRLVWIAVVPLLITVCMGGQLSESQYLFNFIEAIDPQNVLRIDWNGLVPHPCLHKLKGVKCNLQATTIEEIKLENLNLSGIIDADALCKLRNLRVLSLAKNQIRGTIPNSISYCSRLTYLNLRNNLLSGTLPLALNKLKYLRSLDISNNLLSGRLPMALTQLKHLRRLNISNNHFIKQELKNLYTYSLISSTLQQNSTGDRVEASDSTHTPSESPKSMESYDVKGQWYESWATWTALVLGMGFFVLLITYIVRKKAANLAKEKEIQKFLQDSPLKTPPARAIEEVKPIERRSELVFFVEEHERFKLEDLLEATADLRNQTLCSSLYKVILKNSALYAVKRLKKLQVSFEEFGQTMRQIGSLKHPNILPLVGYHSTNEEKLFIYKYQSNGSLLNVIEEYIEGKRDFPWGLRLSIASGIAKGLGFMYQSSDDQEIISHGNLKLSNILLDENNEPLISEYGFSKFLDPKQTFSLTSNGYTAPEKSLTEQGDVFSFGVILLELLTGKTVENSGIDLPKWVRAMVREEWTGEVFDKEINKASIQWAFPLLNIALKCVSHFPDDRPPMAEVLEKIEEVVNAQREHSISPDCCCEPIQNDCCILHTLISDTWDSPGSNY